MQTKKRAPGGGRRRKINDKEVADILASNERVVDLAAQYKVHHDTIYRLFRERRKKNMNIEIILQPDELPEDQQENCVFCDIATAYWNIETNRPVCPLCSVMYKTHEIAKAPYNY